MDLKTAIESLAGSGAEISWCFLPEEDGNWLEIEEAIEGLGKAARRMTVYEDGKEPYVIEYIEATVKGVRVHAQWSRPATAWEISRAQRHENRHTQTSSFTATRLVG